MPSQSYQTWIITRVKALDEIEAAHQAVGGLGRGRRYATQQINHAYAVLLSSQFQGFCRDLHSECAVCLAGSIGNPALEPAVARSFTQDRKLDRGNPNPGNIGEDFLRVGLAIWPAVRALHPGNAGRQQLLTELNTWRNAIAHQDFDPTRLGGRPTLQLARVRRWRTASAALAKAFDRVARDHVYAMLGQYPW